MTTRIRRRDFLRYAAATAVAASVPRAGRSDVFAATPDEIDRVFPQGLASGDPTPNSVILWTRVEGAAATETVLYEVALDPRFRRLVATGQIPAEAAGDHTVKLNVVGLAPYTTYYYRFTALGVTSVTGRTKTAPRPNQDVPVRFAFASCQDFIGRYYHAWRALVEKEEDVDFVLFLGDYIYESGGGAPGSDRRIDLPDGLAIGGGSVALTLADYRTLYKRYRSDPYLKAAHQRFAFVTTWDDHEFANDCWQDHATDFSEARGDEKSTSRREAADQAWFEFQPVDVPFDADASYPDDIRIFRSVRYGRHVELFVVDGRFYRADHLIPEGPVDLTVGKFAANSSLGSRNFVLKSAFDEREAGARPTLLGAAQKSWLIDAVKRSDASWKFLGNDVQMAQMAVDLSQFDKLPAQYRAAFYISTDQWDGYRSERAEILQALADVDNLVSLAGDIHAFYAGELHVDFDRPSRPVAVEFVVAGITSTSLQEEIEITVAGNPTLAALGLADLVPLADRIISDTNPHNVYAKSLSNGIAIVDVDRGRAIEVEFLLIDDVLSPDWDGSIERVRFRVEDGVARIQQGRRPLLRTPRIPTLRRLRLS
ncbi:MAG TPA: alkaline phosphatase D family protein [Candidatus Binatia bacterium]|nr:alkaline phosphatase D family protein [Candidatus Binatia bacterium]